MAGGLGPNCLPRWRTLGAQIEFSCEGIASVIKGLQKIGLVEDQDGALSAQ
jgi:hypothetical protein